MRIAIAYDCVYPSTKGGGERLYRQLALEFAELGHDVDYLTRKQWDDQPPEMGGVSIVAIAGPMQLHDAGGVRKPITAVLFAVSLFRFLVLNRRRYDAVLVSALPVLNVFATRLALLGSSTRVAFDYLEVWDRRRWIEYSGEAVGRVATRLQRLAVRLSPVATCHSQLTARSLMDDGLKSDPIVSPGLLTPRDEVTPRVDVTDDEPPMVLYIGRHIADKRVDTIPAALAFARRSLPSLRAVILGDGPERDRVVAAVRSQELEDCIEMPGFVTEHELDGYLAAAACLVLPSRREGYGLVVVEAACYGTPTVLVDDPGNAAVELIDEGVNGFRAASTAPAVFGESIVRAIREGASLRRTTRAWYDEAMLSKTIKCAAAGILDGLMGANARPSSVRPTHLRQP